MTSHIYLIMCHFEETIVLVSTSIIEVKDLGPSWPCCYLSTFYKFLSCWNLKWIAFATSVEQGQSALPCSLTRLYTFVWPPSSSHLMSLKMIMDSSKMIMDSSKSERLFIQQVLSRILREVSAIKIWYVKFSLPQ